MQRFPTIQVRIVRASRRSSTWGTVLLAGLLGMAATPPTAGQDATPPATGSTRRPLPAPEPVGEKALRVRVVDPEGRPVAGATVATRSIEGERNEEPPVGLVVRLPYGWRALETPTDEEGRALVTGLPPGPLRVAAGALPTWPYVGSGVVEPGGEVTVVLAPMPEDRIFAGRVLGPEGLPARATVRFVWDDRGELRQEYATTGADGSFLILAPVADVRGALLATTDHHTLGSAALDPAVPGTREIELRLGGPDPLVLEIRGEDDQPLVGSATLSWELAGLSVQDYPGPRSRTSEIPWDRPAAPFQVTVSAPGHESRTLGPLAPEELGPRLVVRLAELPKVRGRVLREGRPVPGAEVSVVEVLPDGLPGTAPPARPSTLQGRTDAAGDFAIDLSWRGTAEIRAWSPAAGEGVLGPVEFDPDAGALVVEITRAPGAIEGRVALPPGHVPDELWLDATGTSGYMPLADDGTYRLPSLRPGPVGVSFVQGIWSSDWRPALPTASGEEPSWVHITHGSRAPAWLDPAPTFVVAVRPGETARLDVDLAAPPTCRLEGRVLLDGAAPHLGRRDMYFEPWPAATLVTADGTVVSSTELLADGSFVLRAEEPGSYRLAIDLYLDGELTWHLSDRVELAAGTRTWSVDVATGARAVTPAEEEGRVTAFAGGLLREGPGALRIELPWGPRDDATRVATFDPAPAGIVRLFRDDVDRAAWRRDRTELGTLEIVAGELLTIPSP